MNLTLMKKVAGQWIYCTHDQYNIVSICMEALQWNLYVFDCWLYDDANWAMYTTCRQRMISSREDVAIIFPSLEGQREEALRLLEEYCIRVWCLSRRAKLMPHVAIKEMERAYLIIKKSKKAAPHSDDIRRNSISPGFATYGQLLSIVSPKTKVRDE